MKLSIVLPAYNEEENIQKAAEVCLEYLAGKDGEVIVVDDGSTDKTREILAALVKKHPSLRVIHHPTNLGYATALKDGFLSAHGEWIFYTDADLQFDIQEMDLLFPYQDQADIIVGYRKNRQDPATRIFAARVYNLIIRTLFGVKVRDVDAAFKLFHRSVFDKIRIESSQFLIDAEILSKAAYLKLPTIEVAVTHFVRQGGKSTVRFKHVIQTLLGIGWLWNRIYGSPGIVEHPRESGKPS